ncbi:FMN reductase [Nocardioides sp. LHG3406-4]|uniref:FMN reductase n=1 Tax=Nocardioides sp. LHG3406-4 TaxID=2804575 RepID=UPI003CFA9092
MTRRIAVVSAGLSNPSSTRLLAEQLEAATTRALRMEGEEVEVDVVDLRALAHGLADRLVTGFATGELEEALEAVRRADGVIAVTPVFSASYSGLFKTFFDVLEPDSLRGTPVLLGATAGTARHSLVLEHAMRPLFAYLKAVVVPTAVFAATEDFGGSRATALNDRIETAGAELATLVTAAPAREVEDPYADVTDFATLLAR